MMQQFEAARTGEVGTPHPMNVVVMMYDGSIDYLRRAIECAGGNDETGMRTFTDKTRDIISGLNSALDLDAGGEMAKNLETYYAVMDRILVKAKEDMDAASLRKVMDMLSGVKESWEHVRDSYYQAGQESTTSH